MRISGSDRFLALLGYVLFLFVIPVRWKRDSIFVQFHARQGGVLFGLWFAFSLLMVILLIPFGDEDLLGSVLFGLWFLGTALYLLLALIGITKVLLGERYRMPVVADVALKMGL